MLYLHPLVNSGDRTPEYRHLLGPKSSFVERSCHKAGDSSGHHNTDHHGDEKVNGGGGLKHDDN